MRAVAAALGAAPMALHNHFATKEALVDALLNRVLLRFEPPAPTDDWATISRCCARPPAAAGSRTRGDPALFRSPNPGLGAVRIGELAGDPGPRRLAGAGGRDVRRHPVAQLRLVARSRPRATRTPALGRARRPDAVGAAGRRVPADRAAVAAEMGAYGSDDHYESCPPELVTGPRATAAAPGSGQKSGGYR
jgi:AcrR family transcriptional regulator